MKWEDCPWHPKSYFKGADTGLTDVNRCRAIDYCLKDQCPIVVLFKKCDRQDGEFDALNQEVKIHRNGSIELFQEMNSKIADLTKQVEELRVYINQEIRSHSHVVRDGETVGIENK